MMRRARNVGDYVRYRSALPPRLSEFVILLTARHWTQNYEWYAHAAIAEREGLAPTIIDAVADGRRPADMADDEAAVYDFCQELLRTQGRERPDLCADGRAPGREGRHRRNRHPGLLPAPGDGDEHRADAAPGRGGAGGCRRSRAETAPEPLRRPPRASCRAPNPENGIPAPACYTEGLGRFRSVLPVDHKRRKPPRCRHDDRRRERPSPGMPHPRLRLSAAPLRQEAPRVSVRRTADAGLQFVRRLWLMLW